MERSISVRLLLGLLLAGSVATFGCKKSEDPATVPVPTTTAAAVTPPEPTNTATEDPSASGAPTTPPPVVTATHTPTMVVRST